METGRWDMRERDGRDGYEGGEYEREGWDTRKGVGYEKGCGYWWYMYMYVRERAGIVEG